MLRRILLCATALSAFVCADTLTLKNGRTVNGTYVGGDSRQIRIAVGDRVDSFDVNQVSDIRFGSGSASDIDDRPAPPPPRDRVELTRPDRELQSRDDSPRNSGGYRRDSGMEIPSGTSLVIRLIDEVDSERDRLGQTFRASVDEPVVLNGQTVISRGSDVVAKLVEDKQSGKLAGKTVLTMDLMSVQVGGRMVDITTEEVSTSSGSRTARTGKVVGGTAALGAIIGALAGGGKGAAIGAASGAAVGTGAEVMTKGQRVRIPSETRLTFTLQQPIRL
jgi:hypothetical protein